MNSPRILVVDDNPDVLDLFSTLLGQSGYEVFQAATGQECLRIVRAELPDLVLLDVMLPDLDGFEVCKQIKSDRQTAGVLVIHVSGMRTSADNEAEGLEAGADGYLTKPVTPRAFLAHVNALLRVKQTKLALQQSEKQFRAVFDNSLDAMLIADDQSNYVDANPAACALFGVTRDEMLKRKVSDFVEPVQRSTTEKTWQAFIEAGELRGDFRLYRPDGTTRELEFHAKANFLPQRHLSVLRDVTQRKHAEAMLQQAHDDLDKRVQQRTAELLAANVFLKNEIVQREQATKALRESEEYFRLMVEGIKDYAIFMLDAQGYIATWNEGATRLKGYFAEEIIGQSISLCFTAEDIHDGKLERALEVAAAEGRYEDECWILGKDGVKFWANLIITALRDNEGQLRGFVDITRDITEQKRAAEALSKAKETLQTIFDAAPVAILGLDLEGQITNWSAGAEQMFGWHAEETIGRRCPTVPENGLADFKAMIELTVRGGPQTGMIYLRQKKNGELIHCSINSGALRNAGGGVIGVMVILEDITERKRAEEKLLETNRTLQTLIQASPLAIVGLNPEGIITMWNRAADLIFGWSAAEVMGRPIPFIPEDKSQEFRALFGSALEGESSTDVEILRKRKDGSLVDISLSTAPICDAEGKTIGVIGVMADIMDRKRIQAERAQLMQRLVTTQEEEQRRLSRELHDQMGQSIAALMLGLKSLDNSSHFTATEIDRLHQLQKLTNQIAHDVHHLASSLRPTALDDLGLSTALSNHIEEWSENTGVVADFHSNGLLWQRLPPQIETTVYRVVQEALTNVLKHAKAQHVSVILEHRGNHVRAIVEDDGSGFDVEAIMNKPMSERRLGLMGMKERLSLVGGKLDIESTASAGTTVIIRIPLTPLRLEDSLEETTHSVGR